MCENVCQKMELNVIQTQKIVKEDKNTARIDLIFDKHIQVTKKFLKVKAIKGNGYRSIKQLQY